MEELIKYLEVAPSQLFDPSEMNEVLLSMYIFIGLAVRLQVDTLVINSTDIIWYKNGISVDEFDIAYLEQLYREGKASVRFRGVLNTILQRDEIIRQHVQVLSETAEAVTCRITV